MRPFLRSFVPAAMVFIAACAVCEGGLADGRPWGDMGNYVLYGGSMLDGRIPYRDFFMEYPPGSLLAFIPPALVSRSFDPYLLAFKLEMIALGLVALAATTASLLLLRTGRRRRVIALAVFAASPVLMGHICLNRYDWWPAALVALGMTALLSRRLRGSSCLLGLAFAVKWFSFMLLPVLAIEEWRRAGARAAFRVVAWFVAVGSACYAFFLVVAFHGLAVDTWAQLHRQLQIESVAASGLLVLDRLGLYNATIVAGNPGSIDLGGSLPSALGALTTVIQVCAAVGVALALTRGRLTPQRLATAATAEVLVFVVFGKVLSPQFLIWLVPLVPLVADLGGLVATLLLPLALLATQIEVEGYSGLHIAGYSVVLLAIRNVLLLVLFGAVALEVWRGTGTPEAARLP